ncbi:MAG TPA: ABC transporter ATP-binding protein [Limnobacter sp.]|nr:ABC transporter ATP-binding protein [Limnobacter sp.]
MLEVQGMTVSYGGVQAVKGISLAVRSHELVCLIGCNGAGKTTTLKALAGLLPFHAHHATLDGQHDLQQLPAHERLGLGMALVPEGRGVFTRMSIEENLELGASQRSNKRAIEEDKAHWLSMFPRLKERRKQLAGTLSGGEQQMLAIARALMGRPKCLLLDEPSMGLAPIMVEKIFEVIQTIHQQGVTILLVEQNAQIALQIASRAYVMDSGLIDIQGDAASLIHDPRIREAYLGEAPATDASKGSLRNQ